MHHRTFVSIIIVTYNNEATIADCLDSISAAVSGASVEVLLWDNNSADSTLQRVADAPYRPSVVTAFDGNIGFAAAANRLLTQATGDYVLFLNPDCVMRPDTLGALLTALQSDPSLGAVGPLVRGVTQGRNHAGGGWQPTLGRLAVEIPALPSLAPTLAGSSGVWARSRALSLCDGVYRVDWVAGTCLLIGRQTMLDLDGFDERWFMYCEDMDLGRRLSAAGLTSGLVPDTEVLHVGGASHGSDSPALPLQATSLLGYFDLSVTRATRTQAVVFRALLLAYYCVRWVVFPQARRSTAVLMRVSLRHRSGRRGPLPHTSQAQQIGLPVEGWGDRAHLVEGTEGLGSPLVQE
jgi:GT2 family glycosyltransferase